MNRYPIVSYIISFYHPSLMKPTQRAVRFCWKITTPEAQSGALEPSSSRKIKAVTEKPSWCRSTRMLLSWLRINSFCFAKKSQQNDRLSLFSPGYFSYTPFWPIARIMYY